MLAIPDKDTSISNIGRAMTPSSKMYAETDDRLAALEGRVFALEECLMLCLVSLASTTAVYSAAAIDGDSDRLRDLALQNIARSLAILRLDADTGDGSERVELSRIAFHDLVDRLRHKLSDASASQP